MALTVIKAKFGAVELGEALGVLREGSVELFSFERDSSRTVQIDHLYPKASDYAVPRDRANLRGELSFSVIKMESNHLERLKYFETLQAAVDSLREADLTFTDDNWATTALTYADSVFRSLRIVNDTPAGLTLQLSFVVTMGT